jgi:hypothetical protein
MMRLLLGMPCVLFLFACATEEGSTKDDDSERTATTFSGSACQSCLTDACASELDDCSADPGCSRYWNCLSDCELNELGGPDASCEKLCIDRAGVVAGSAGLDVAGCLWAGPGASCEDCGTISAPDVTDITDQSCEASTEAEACLRCEDSTCCETHVACSAEPECGALLRCEQDCAIGDTACVVECAAAHPGGRGLLGARVSCLVHHCPVDCGNGALQGCEACMWDGCGDLYVACQADDECYSLSLCATVCETDFECLTACHEEFPDGAAAYDAWAVCSYHRCAEECAP